MQNKNQLQTQFNENKVVKQVRTFFIIIMLQLRFILSIFINRWEDWLLQAVSFF